MRKPDSRVEIDLMMRRKLVGSPEVQELPEPPRSGKSPTYSTKAPQGLLSWRSR